MIFKNAISWFEIPLPDGELLGIVKMRKVL